ncbi:MAG: NnrU family protein, partial [Gammaproteobacteria bacterium]|nr:NnrU family protein [Gammaproteobacteria bacterium]
MNELAWLALWAALFVTQHLGVPSSGLRPRLVGAVGEKGYLGLYSVVSIVVLVLLIRAYVAATPTGVLWPTYELLRWVPLVLMPVALWLVIGGLLQANPTMVGV